jgi:hypothetical protein
MFLVRGLENGLALVFFVDRVFFGHVHRGNGRACFFVVKSNVVAHLDALVIGGDRDRDRPERAVGHGVLVANALPVRLGHEAGERRESPDSHHNGIRGFPGSDGNVFEAFRLLDFRLQLFPREQKRHEFFLFAMGCNKIGHK